MDNPFEKMCDSAVIADERTLADLIREPGSTRHDMGGGITAIYSKGKNRIVMVETANLSDPSFGKWEDAQFEEIKKDG